jgi:uncharacterized tellurite resistance protein B-like protein
MLTDQPHELILDGRRFYVSMTKIEELVDGRWERVGPDVLDNFPDDWRERAELVPLSPEHQGTINADPVDDDEGLRAEVEAGLDEAKGEAGRLDLEEVKSGDWFVRILQQVLRAYDRNARAEYFQRKYLGLPPDEIADRLTSVVSRTAAVAGGVTGIVTTGAEVSTVITGGMTATVFAGAIGSEMVYLTQMQMRLVLDLAVLYDVEIDTEDPEDMLLVFGYALGVSPTGMMSKFAQKAAGHATKRAVRKYISKGVLQSVKSMGAKIGVKILQRTIIKFSVPAASAVVGSSFNYMTTKSIAKVAELHFSQRGATGAEMRALLARCEVQDLVYPAAAMYMANVDGHLAPAERDLYLTVLSRLSLPDDTRKEFEQLAKSEADILEAAAARLTEPDERRAFLDVLSLLAVCDGELADEEREFLSRAAETLGVPIDLTAIEDSTRDYRVAVERDFAAEATASVKRTTNRVRGGLGKLLLRGLPDEADA